MSAKLDRFNNIKGFLHPDEGKFLYELSSRECRERFAVEIGSYCGKSACFIGLACKENDTKLFSIDHHRGCLLYTSPSPRDLYQSRMPSSA